MKRRNGSFEKSARMIILRDLQKQGRLVGLSYREIARLFNPSPSAMTIMRDMRDLPTLEAALGEMRATIS